MTINSVAQFFTVLILFVAVLVLTAFVSKWIAKYQKLQETGANIEIVETTRISTSKYIQIARVGDHYVAYAVCKDTITKLADISEDELLVKEAPINNNKSFKDVLELLKKQKQ